MKTPKSTPRQTLRPSRAPAAPAQAPAEVTPTDLALLLASYAEALRGEVKAKVSLEGLAADADKTAAEAAVGDAARQVAETGAAIDSFVATLGQPKPAAASVTSAAAPSDGVTRVRVAGPKQGRWRIGRQFFPEPVEIDVNAQQLDTLEADPKLSVSRL